MVTDELIDAVRDWGREKGINNADKQLMKVFEETNEITREFVRGRYDTPEVVDSLGGFCCNSHNSSGHSRL